MMPASLAACSGSPFFTAPARTNRRAVADMRTVPRATASRSVTGFAPTSTMVMRPRASTWLSAGLTCLCPFVIDASLAFIIDALSQKERKAFERHGEVDALQLDAGRHLQRARREVQDGLDA